MQTVQMLEGRLGFMCEHFVLGLLCVWTPIHVGLFSVSPADGLFLSQPVPFDNK